MSRAQVTMPAISVGVVVLVFGIGRWVGQATELQAQYVTKVEYTADRSRDRERYALDSADRASIKRMLVKLSCKILRDCDP